MTQRELAIYTAGKYHQDQMYGEAPYVYHLAEVDQVLEQAGFIENCTLRTASWLHDILEDTTMTREELEKLFNFYVDEIVWRVTNEEGANRKERAIKTYPKIVGNPLSICLKLADRIANIEFSHRNKSKQQMMYLKEHEFFQESFLPFLIQHNHYQQNLWNRYIVGILAIKAYYGIEKIQTA